MENEENVDSSLCRRGTFVQYIDRIGNNPATDG
jgi:hypothetical protein